MNEIKHIHLGRQQFTIAVDAHKLLREYIDAIKAQVGVKASDVIDEVEARMAELLTERGVTGDKVVLPEDIAFLKEQLGEPRDFKEDDEPEAQQPLNMGGPKRLFRDTQNGMLAGVCSGLAAYFGLDAVIVRLIFVLLTLMSGTGLLLYLVLWLIVPEAKTTSERLQMRGKAVTVDSLKQVVDRADLPGAARRAHRTFGRVVEGIFKVLLAIVGVVFVIAGSVALLWTMAVSIYFLLHEGKVAGQVLFPVGTNETVAFVSGVVALAIALLFMILIGVAMVRRKWQLPGWGVAALLGVFFVSSSLGVALAANVVPQVQQRFDALHHTQTHRVVAFKNVMLTGDNTTFTYVPDSNYKVAVSYLGSASAPFADVSDADGTLHVDTNHLAKSLHTCTAVCLYSDSDLHVTIYAPSLASVSVQGDNASFASTSAPTEDNMTITAHKSVFVRLDNVSAQNLMLISNKDSDTRTYQLGGIQPANNVDELLRADEDVVNVGQVRHMQVSTNEACDEGDPFVFLNDPWQTLTINGKQVKSDAELMRADRNTDIANDCNCVVDRNGTPIPPAAPRP